MNSIQADDPRAAALSLAIRDGDGEALRRCLQTNLELATIRVVDQCGVARTLLHMVADWPGHFANGAQTVAILAAAGADVNAQVLHTHQAASAETALHWAASSNDVPVLDALLDNGADIEAPGAVFTGGTAMSDAVVFAQWNAAHRLLARGAKTTIWQAAALGLLEHVQNLRSIEQPTAADITNAFWHSCRGGHQRVAEYLLEQGADPNWMGYDHRTACDVADESGNEAVVQWLRTSGARRAAELIPEL